MKFEIQVPKEFKIVDSELEKFLIKFTNLSLEYKNNGRYAEDIVHDFISLYNDYIEEGDN